MKQIKYLLIYIIVFYTNLLAAETSNSNPLKGDYNIADDYSNERLFNLHFEGKVAERLYNHLDVKAENDACTGGLIKDIENISCSKQADTTHNKKTYECWFSINKKGKIKSGVTC
jgi:hypothetical protein